MEVEVEAAVEANNIYTTNVFFSEEIADKVAPPPPVPPPCAPSNPPPPSPPPPPHAPSAPAPRAPRPFLTAPPPPAPPPPHHHHHPHPLLLQGGQRLHHGAGVRSEAQPHRGVREGQALREGVGL